MMKVRYRLIEKWWADRQRWVTWGALYENCGSEATGRQVLFRALPDEHKSVRHYFDRRIKELNIGLDDGERMLGKYAHRFRLKPDVRSVQGATHAEVRQRLWQRVRQALQDDLQAVHKGQVVYAPQPAYHALREEKDEYHAG